jgi:hypothetical protein
MQDFIIKKHFLTPDKAMKMRLLVTLDTEIWATGGWSVTVKGQNFGPVEAKGYYGAIYVREGDTLKKRMETWNLTPKPEATGTPTPSTTKTP